MKQTAVEWLIEIHFGSIENCTPLFRKHIDQAKEIEKQQIKEYAKFAINCDRKNMPILNFEDYINL